MTDLGYASTNLEGYRVTLLDETGNFLANSAGAYACSDGISFSNAFINQDGTVYQQRTGTGAFCVNRTGPSAQTGATVTISICTWQYALMYLMMGGKLAYNGGGDVIGWSMPDPDEVSSRRFCLEAWTLAIDGEVQAEEGGYPAYHHHIWPQATAIVNDFELADAVNVFGLVCTTSPNPNVGNGPFNDWPNFDNDTLLDGHPSGAWAAYIDNDPPDFLCQTANFVVPAS